MRCDEVLRVWRINHGNEKSSEEGRKESRQESRKEKVTTNGNKGYTRGERESVPLSVYAGKTHIAVSVEQQRHGGHCGNRRRLGAQNS